MNISSAKMCYSMVMQADRYVWRDSQGLVRSVAIKKQCAANTGNGGYAIQATFPSSDNPAETVTLTTNDTRDGGFGYFVAHERTLAKSAARAPHAR
jgi:hypothetical protein